MVPNASAEPSGLHVVSEYRYATGEAYRSSAELVARMVPKCRVTIRVDGDDQRVTEYHVDLAPRTRVERYSVTATGEEWMKRGEHYVTTLTRDVSAAQAHYVATLHIPATRTAAFLALDAPPRVNGTA